ncbi:hypothetical protein NUW58_g4827 [Xylaria curta]|uniref:Uncharacterized protein n=1 Tax=Xylaria curta TaxID=42375 RepID=A0ACC1P799_9PEZI|nr:hypothetical protein NUW58_g4827 [Xylaria curta]
MNSAGAKSVVSKDMQEITQGKETISREVQGHKANLTNPNTSETSKEHSRQVIEHLGGDAAHYSGEDKPRECSRGALESVRQRLPLSDPRPIRVISIDGMMTGLPEGWESDYDGARWFYRYKATGITQYHFPQLGDEFAEFLLDAGTGPLVLSPEESLAIEQQAKRRSISGLNNDTKSAAKTSGSKREKKKIEAIEEEDGMSATGYFDSSSFMYFPGAYTNVSPLGDDDGDEGASSQKPKNDTRNGVLGMTPEVAPPITQSEPIFNLPANHAGVSGNGDQTTSISVSNIQPVAAELPEGGRQMWSPVGYVAELATWETVKCAEELAPVELDATSSTPVPIQTNIARESAELFELPTHRTPVEEKATDVKPTQPIIQPVDSIPLVSASFAYPPLKSNVTSDNGVSPATSSTARIQVSSITNSADLGQNKYQSWNPTQGIVEQQSQMHNKASEALPQISVLQNQDSELGNIGWKTSGNVESPIPGEVPSTLAQPSKPSKATPVEPATNPETVSIPAVLQPAHRPAKEPTPITATNQHSMPGMQGRHDSISDPVASHDPSVTPYVLKPGGSQLNGNLQENVGNVSSSSSSSHYPQGSAPSQPPPQVVQASPGHGGQPGVTRVHTLPDHPPSTNPSPPKMNGSPGFLLFHEIPSASNLSTHGITTYPEQFESSAGTPHSSGSGRIHSQSANSLEEQIPVVAPLSFVKRHSSKSSGVSSITPDTQGSSLHSDKPTVAPPDEISDEISEVISVISSFTPQETPAPSLRPYQYPTHTGLGGNYTPSSTSTSNGACAPTNATNATTPPMNAQSQLPGIGVQKPSAFPQVSEQATPAAVNISVPISVTATAPVAQTNIISSPGGVGISTMQITSATQAIHRPSPPIQGSLNQHQKPPPLPSSQTMNPSKISEPPGPLKPQGNAPNPFPQTSATIAASRPPAQAGSGITHPNPAHQSQVSSPAQSIASLHISQASTPSNTFATVNNLPGPPNGPSVNSNPTATPPVRPPSVTSHSPPVANPPVKPYPMLPGQVTPLPSQVGSAPVPPPTQQPMFNNHAKPTVNTPAASGPKPTQTAAAGPTQLHTTPAQSNPVLNPVLNAPQGSMIYGPAPSQVSMKPPQQQTHSPLPHSGASHAGGHQSAPNQPQPQQTTSFPLQTTTIQPHNPQMVLPHPTGGAPVVGQHTFPPPPVAPTQQLTQSTQGVTSPVATTQGKPFTSAQATAALTDAGKGMKKWAKKMLKIPPLSRRRLELAVLSSMGVNGVAGAQLASSLYASANRPPLAHAQTAPPHAHGAPGTVPQLQSMQAGQPYQQPGRPQIGHPQAGHSLPVQAQPIHQPVGVQTPGRPPVIQNPALAAGVAVNFNAQAQAQASFMQQQQFPPGRPVVVGIPPPPPLPPPMFNAGPPGPQGPARSDVDPNLAAAAAVVAGSAVAAAFRQDNAQSQQAHGNAGGHAQPAHATNAEPHHEQAYGSSIPPQAPVAYGDNNYAAADTTHSVNNTYVENTEVVNNTIYIDNSTSVVTDTTFNSTGYADTTSFGGIDVTASASVDASMNSTFYADSSATTFSMDESMNVASTSGFAMASVDYSGSGYGDFDF